MPITLRLLPFHTLFFTIHKGAIISVLTPEKEKMKEEGWIKESYQIQEVAQEAMYRHRHKARKYAKKATYTVPFFYIRCIEG